MKQARTFQYRELSARCANALLAFIVIFLPLASARADEGGVSFWLPGQYSSFAAVPSQPGWYIPPQLYCYDGSARGTKNFERGDALNRGLSSQVALIYFTPTWVLNEKW
jgi:hypothetical protein